MIKEFNVTVKPPMAKVTKKQVVEALHGSYEVLLVIKKHFYPNSQG